LTQAVHTGWAVPVRNSESKNWYLILPQ
jgi:hypothetical protein